MYTTYESEQFRIEHIWGLVSGPHASPPKVLPCPLSKPTFKPTKLIRVEDMQVVQGAEVHEGYCALSYSWSWSGDMIKEEHDKEYRRLDKRHHQIKAYITENDWRMKTTRNVIFEDLIQKICMDFNVRYIWYDQMCIDQTNRKQKQLEIKQMHSVYRHADCTVVLVPELCVTSHLVGSKRKNIANIDAMQNAEWCKRAWTLEEAYMSKRLLFIGRNVHMWSDAADNVKPGLGHDEHFFYSICTKSMKWNASTVLWHARNRISSKPHDRIFALANMFPEIINDINFSYNQHILNLMRTFYNLVAAKDLSILCFGAPLEPNKKVELVRHPEDDSLPSWSGIDGLHLPQMESGDMHLQASAVGEYTLQSGLFLCLKCTCTTVLLETAYENQPPIIPTALANRARPYNHLLRGSEDEHRLPISPAIDVPPLAACYGFFPDTTADSTSSLGVYIQGPPTPTPEHTDTAETPLDPRFSSSLVSDPRCSSPYQLPTNRSSSSHPVSSQYKVPSYVSPYPLFSPQLAQPMSNPFQPPSTVPQYPPFPVLPPQLYYSSNTSYGRQQYMPMPEPQHVVFPVVYSSLTFVPDGGKSIHYETFMRAYGLKVTHWLPIRKIDGVWTPTSASTAHRSGGYLSLVDDDCSQCLILSGLRFRAFANGVTALPVVKDNGMYYKSIGLCFLTDHINLDYGNETEKKITIQ